MRNKPFVIIAIVFSIVGVLTFVNSEPEPVEALQITIPPMVGFPLGEVSYFNTTGTTVTIPGQSDGYTNMVTINPTTTFLSAKDFTNGGSDNGILEYTGSLGKYFHIASSITTSATNNNDILVYAVAKNGIPVDGSKIMMKLGQTTDVTSSAMHVVLYLEKGDTIEICVANYSGGADVIVKSLNFVAVSMD